MPPDRPTPQSLRAAAMDALFRGAGEAILLLASGAAEDWAVTDANPAAQRLFGIDAGRTGPPRTLADLSAAVQPAGGEPHLPLEHHLQRAAATGAARFAWSFRRADGTAFLADVRLVSFEHDGRKALAAMIRDRGREAPDAAREAVWGSEQRLRDIVEANPVPVAVTRPPNNRIVYANHHVAEMLGLPLDALLGRSGAEFFARPEDAERAAAAIERDGSLEGVEYLFRRADGSEFWLAVTARPITYEGEPAIIAGFHDLTERKRAEAADARLKTVLDAIPASIHVKDRSLRYVMANRYFLEAWKTTQEAVLGHAQEDVLRFGNWRETLARDRSVLQTGLPTGFYEAGYDDGRRGRVALWANKIPLLDEAGEVSHIVTVGMDITKLKDAEAEIARQREALHQSEKLTALGSLLAGVAHELNNPLSVVLTQAVLMKETTADDRAAARADKIHAAAERCARIVKSFLAIARQRPPERSAVQLDAVARSAVELTAYGLRSSGIDLVLDFAPDLPPVWGDPDQLGQVLMNMIINAQQVLQEVQDAPRRLRLATAPFGAGMVQLTIADNGPGIPPQIRSRIFDPFFTTKPVGTGTGMGLSLCMGVIASHNGTLHLEDAPGGGAMFVVRLPRADGVAAPAEPPPAPAPASGKSILIVDDEPEIAQSLAEIVAPLARRVDIAENGIAALRRMETVRYDLIISDLRMPELDGPGLYRRLRAAPGGFDGRFLFITGDTLGHDLEPFLQDTGAPFLEKPFAPAEVKRRVAELIGRSD